MGDSYKEAVVHQGPIHNGIEVVQPGLEPVYAKPESAHQSDVTPTKTPDWRRWWIALIAAALVAAVIALAVGLGVGLTRSSSSNSSSAASQSITSVSTAATSSPSSRSTTETPSSSTSTSTTMSGTSNALPTSTTTYNKSHKYSCPGANNTEIQDVGNSAGSSYVVFCDADIHATNKKDLSSTVQDSFADCLGLCDSMNDYQNRRDIALTWNFEGTGQQTPGTCWCLAGSHKGVISNPGNMVAVLVSEDLTVDL